MREPEGPLDIGLHFSRHKDAHRPSRGVSRGTHAYQRVDADARVTQAVDFDWDEVHDALAALQGPASEPSRKPRSHDDAIAQLAEAIGQFLRDSHWPEKEIHAALVAGRRVNLTIRLGADELYRLPWEFVTFEGSAKKLAAYPRCLIRYEWQDTRTAPSARRPEAEGGRVLFASHGVDPTVTRLQKQAVGDACGKAAAFEELPVLSRDELKKALRRGVRDSSPFSVLHILCHGVARDPAGTAFGVKWLDAAPVMSEDLESDLEEFAPTLRLVVLSACSSGEAGAAGSYIGSAAKGVHRAGIEAVVASRLPLSNDGSIEFTTQFYRGLLEDAFSVEEAFLAARNGLGGAGPRLDASALKTDQLSLQLYARERDGFDTRPIAFSPYQGLRPFRREHKRFFCGRDVEVQELVREFEALVGSGEKPRFMMVMGASGSGKSSMVLAGAVPIIEAKGWVSTEILPGDDPLARLEEGLETLEQDSDAERRGLLVVDQFEELFTHVADARGSERVAFARRLWDEARKPGGIGVILTMRTEFMSRCRELQVEDDLNLEQVASRWAENTVLVAQMSAAQLTDAICEPARRVGLTVAEAVRADMLRDVGGKAGALPLVQHLLAQMWSQRDGRTLTAASYAALGGVGGALNQHAEAVFTELMGRDDHEAIARRMMLMLVHVGRGDEPNTRHRRSIGELCPEDASDGRSREVLEALLRARLLVRTDDFVEVAHEALIRTWARLVGWIQSEGDVLRDRDELRALALSSHAEAYSRLQLDMADRVLARYPEETAIGKLAAASRAERTRVADQARRYKNRLRVTLAREYVGKDAMIAAALLREVEAEDLFDVPLWFETATAVLEKPAITVVTLEHPEDVVSMAWSPDGRWIATTTNSPHEVRVWDAASGELRSRLETEIWRGNVVWSPTGSRLMIWGEGGAKLREVTERGEFGPPEGSTGTPTHEDLWHPFASLEWGSSGQRVLATFKPVISKTSTIDSLIEEAQGLVTASSEQTTLMVWKLTPFEPICWRCDNGLLYAAFNRDETRIVARATDRADCLLLLDASTGEEIRSIKGVSDGVRVVWSPEGGRFAGMLEDGTGRIWRADSGEEICAFRRGANDHTFALNWSPNGASLLVTGWSWSMEVVDAVTVASRWLRPPGDGQRSHHDSVCWSPDGTRIATRSGEGVIQILGATTGRELLSFPDPALRIDTLEWSPDSVRLLTRTGRTLRVWNVLTGTTLGTAEHFDQEGLFHASLPSHEGVTLSIQGATQENLWTAFTGGLNLSFDGVFPAWSPKGDRFVTWGFEMSRVWNAVTGEVTNALPGPEMVRNVVWDPGPEIVFACQDGTTSLWTPEWPGAAQLEPTAYSFVVAMAWNPDGQRLARLCTQHLTLWTWLDGTVTLDGAFNFPASSHSSLAWSPDGLRIVIAGSAGAVVWSAEAVNPVPLFLTIAEAREGRARWPALSSSFQSDGAFPAPVGSSLSDIMAVCGANSGGTLWSIPDTSEFVAWNPEGTRVAARSRDDFHVARLWNTTTGRAFATLRSTKEITGLAWSPKGTPSRILAGERMWNLDTEHLRERLWQATRSCMSAETRRELLDEDDVTAEQNAAASRTEEARRRAARPVLDVRVVKPWHRSPA